MKLPKLSDILLYSLLKKEIEESLYKSRTERIVEEVCTLDTKEYQKNNEIKDILQKFVTIFKRNFTVKQTQHMYYKLKDLKVFDSKQTQIVGKSISLGNYDSKNNKITIVHLSHPMITKLIQEETYYHELLHMASTVRTRNKIYVGLEIPGLIGIKLNEGYTEYLTRKYFTRGEEYVQTSDIGIIFAKGIENIIGKEKMQKYYFSGNLEQLIEDLSKYKPREDIIKLLFLMDTLCNKFTISKDTNDIIREIAKLNKIKLDMDLKAGKISREKYNIEKIMKVDHYHICNLWSEETRVVENEDTFYLEDQGYKSRVYTKDIQD